MDTIRGKLRIVVWHSDDSIASLSAYCPACHFEHSFNVNLDGAGHWERDKHPVWDFDGNYDSPTFSPSMLANSDGEGGAAEKWKPICHSFLVNGVWEFLNDSTHALAGQKVALPAPDPDMSFTMRHGWHWYPHWDEEEYQRKQAEYAARAEA